MRKVMEEHPEAPNPVVTGNCQGGWATLLLAASNPDLTGPIVLNGSPVSTWSGRVGENPMRYNGGILGGAYNAMYYSDLGHGVFDGADIVQNFELLNPSLGTISASILIYMPRPTRSGSGSWSSNAGGAVISCSTKRR